MIVCHPAIEGLAVNGYAWTWSFSGQDAAENGQWPARLDVPVLLTRAVGEADLAQETTPLDARGLGSDAVHQSVMMRDGCRWSTPATLVVLGASQVHLRVIVQDPRTSGVSVYLDVPGVVTLRRNGSNLELVGSITEIFDIEPLLGTWLLIDLEVVPTLGYTLRVNGIHVTPIWVGGAVPAFAEPVALHVGNNAAGTASAIDTRFVFVGIRVGGSGMTTEVHRAHAFALGVLFENAVASYGEDAWRLSAHRAVAGSLVLDAEAGEDFGLADDVTWAVSTGPLEVTGLGRTRRNKALTGTAAREAPSGFEALEGDFSGRVLAFIPHGATTSHVLWSVGSVQVEVDPSSGDIEVTWPGYSVTCSGAWDIGRWHLLDVVMDRDGGLGGVAQWRVYLDGVQLVVPDHSGLVADQGADVPLAVYGTWCYAAWGPFVMTLSRHQFDARALGVSS